jgi:universal stress protein E
MERFTSILVDVDATAAVHHELERAASLARRCGASLTIVDSMTASADAAGPLPANIDEAVVAARRDALVRLACRVREIPSTSRLLVGPSATVLIHEVLRSKHDLLVRSHARDLSVGSSNRYGAVDEELLRKCPCPVLLVGPGRTPASPRIAGVVTAGGHDSPEDALRLKVVELTRLMARLEDGAPMLLQTWAPFAEHMIRTNSLEDAFAAHVEAVRHRAAGHLAQLTQSLGGNVSDIHTMSRRGEPSDIIPEFTVREGIDLVVMATPTNTGSIAGFLFRRASLTFLKKLTCSLLAVKSDGSPAYAET